ncbi:OLC1v1029225C1 [Oldenlandia corymbosa var. corymbosa]|uniref:OLC1v1029225C1 n=1 Tax=Oldenlandia corymbosa var. corymbosa TaxID=529605 RepID=A0AAV1CF56_OLDCO|nr:OLC1v1029225C1 [Oldenlandia corymbosa var. corymbosa]
MKEYRPEVVALFEPRISGGDRDKFIKNSGFQFSFMVETEGFPGGYMGLVEALCVGRGFDLSPAVCSYGGDEREGEGERERMLCTFIYASPRMGTRRMLWEEVRRVADGVGEPWVVGGDMNSILHESDRKGGSSRNGGPCNLFSDWIGFRRSSQLWALNLHGVEEELLLIQQATRGWTLSGNHNTFFYHRMVRAQSNRRRIVELKGKDDVPVSGQANLERLTADYFKRLYTELNFQRPTL